VLGVVPSFKERRMVHPNLVNPFDIQLSCSCYASIIYIIWLLYYRLCNALQKAYEEWFLLKYGALKDYNEQHGLVISAMVRENVTAGNEERFKVILMSAGTKYNFSCSSTLSDFSSACDGHSEALCYDMIVIYFMKLIQKRNFKVLLYSKEGFQLSPEYRFHLFISRSPCGFMRDEREPLLSWKTPFVKLPHVLKCSSKIVINSYLGIQGPLICLFAKPVYISEVIILNTDNVKIEKVHKKFEEAKEKLNVQQSMFSFHPPKVVVLDVPTLFSTNCLNANCQEVPLTSVAVLRNPCDDCNPVFSVRVFKKSNEKNQETDQQENEILIHPNNPVWSENPIKLHFNEFINVYKAMIKNLKVFQELVNLKNRLKEDCQRTSSELKEQMDNSLAEIKKLVKEMDCKQYETTNVSATEFLHYVDKLKNKKEQELKTIADMEELIKQLGENKEPTPMCCCWKRYLTILQLIETRLTLY